MVMQSLSLLQSSTNANFRRELLQHMDGVTNAALKQPLLAMLDETADNGTRAQMVNMLRRYVDDPVIESKMWDLALNDPNTNVRDQAREAVARAPATPERIEQLRNKAASPDASLDERLISFRALRLAKSHTPELVSELATVAQNSTDPIARAKLFKSFNGLTDPVLMAPLVTGLQDADPIVRQNAADSLSSFPDPRVQEWLNHLIQTDTDPTVKREAHAALEHSQRASRRVQVEQR
jgi:HEAT repeat protein